MSLAVPTEPDQITAEWMTAALAERFPGAVVEKVRVADVMLGTTTRARLDLKYSAGTGPPSVFVKLNGSWSHRLLLLTIGFLFPEGRLYAQRQDLPIGMPDCYGTGEERGKLATFVVMEDLGLSGARPNDATVPMSPEDVAAGLEGLARMHSRFWGLGTVAAVGLGWVRPWPFARFAVGLANAVRAGLRRAEQIEALSGAELPGWREQLAMWRRYHGSLCTGTPTLLHGDAHVGNTYRTPEGGTGFIDWQLVRKGSWEHDVGYFLVSALEVEDRRAHERELLDGYLRMMRKGGVTGLADQEVWDRYRSTAAYGLGAWIATLGLANYQSEAISVITVGRFAAAARDHDTARLLGVS